MFDQDSSAGAYGRSALCGPLVVALAIRYWTTRPSLTANGRVYSASANIVDIPIADAAAANHDQGATRLAMVGATAERPTYVPAVLNGGLPREMFDLTLNKPIFLVSSNPPTWTDITGAAV
jgi:hypothetical protein